MIIVSGALKIRDGDRYTLSVHCVQEKDFFNFFNGAIEDWGSDCAPE